MKKRLLTLLFMALSLVNSYSQTIINSLIELESRLDDSNGDFKMTPGTYYFNVDNCGSGNLFPDSDILLFTGSNSTFDFTDVKFEFDSKIFAESYDDWAVQFWPTGNNNVYLNLTMEILGNEVPNAGGEAIHFDGADNRIEGFHITQRSSFPYGYGDIFGKGGVSVINHSKRAGILVRGDRNHLKNCTLLMRSYGHGIFMQGSIDALIEGCYVEGELRTIAEVLQEEGTSSPADSVDFETVWGYNLRELDYDYHFSLQEDGIRCYGGGLIYGTEDERDTAGTQVINCTVVKMRSGVGIGLDPSAKYVEGCTALACETGYWVRNDSQVVNSSGDTSIGPLVTEDLGGSNSTYELTILDDFVTRIDNDVPHFFFAGSHELTLDDGTTSFDSDIILQVGGRRFGHRWLEGSGEEPIERGASNMTFTNNTKYPVLLESNVSNSDITSCGPVTDNGSGNRITESSDCSYDRLCVNTADNLEAECYDNMSGVVIEGVGDNNEKVIGSINNGDWISFSSIDLTNMASVNAIAGTSNEGVSMEIREGSSTGTLLGTLPIPITNNFFDYQETTTVDLVETINGTTDVYFVFTGPTGFLFNLDKISFIPDPCEVVSYDPVLLISAEDFCDASGVSLLDVENFNQIVSDINDRDYIKFSNILFGNDNIYNSVRILASSTTNGGEVEVRSGSLSGELLTTIEIYSTGSLDEYKIFSAYTDQNITGTQDLYFVFSEISDASFQLDNIRLLYDQCAGRSYEAYDRIEAENFCENGGVEIINNYIGNVQSGDWIRFSDVDFTTISPESVTISLSSFSSDGYVDVRLDNPTNGILIANANISSTEGWTNWEETTIEVTQNVTGVHDVYIYFGDSGNNMNWFQFNQDPNIDLCEAISHDGYSKIEAEDFCDMLGVEVFDNSYLGNIQSGDWVKYGNVNFENNIPQNVILSYATPTIDETVNVKLDNPTSGEIIATITVPSTNGWTNFEEISTSISTNTDLTGLHDIYLVYEGGINTNWFQFSYQTLSVDTHEAADKINSIHVYPNPVVSYTTIVNAKKYTASIYDLNGKFKFSQYIANENEIIDLRRFTSGVYYAKIHTDTQILIKKIVKK